MYVCLCKGITERQLKEAIAEGNTEFMDLKRELGVGSQCGKCIPVALAILAEETAKNAVFYEVA
ncbi:bacterioferritin-associated ferredoxin [Oceanimonas baumannii]|uniref:Bacterioferritin-associated ferredoxin n=1 Tax=Oceanimonas baumannii TaxID=129578 RepID=A0A235CMN3_9GAMM|nr:bacterioferritin-associated ferredoxin [Oceanimonas baumannii]MCC4265955.1 bacterioferritin-associated ferredoxin [Oceanimonas baumannii]OYD25634.1 (2Fe-2S)-binding protein [Oceanimonas baumannii]TDW61152.1 bacterioferritin-associated ferredoxin [Oceanimonas baumannii]